MTISYFQVIQTSRDPFFAIFMLLEPYSMSSPPYIESKNLHWWKTKPRTLAVQKTTKKQNKTKKKKKKRRD